ncbi:Type 1 glutamine amidotransferase-like domain-containing protein [Priestia aryabhattai]|uniref:Type 1 glutamine amidotransferase-like domain-containing protein n=1 Tax=Priestia megaterium TaxID=1404 RepID=UPI0039B9B5A8
MNLSRQIIAISGGGFSKEIPAYIDEYIVKQVQNVSKIRICFIPTASNDAVGYINKFYEAFSSYETTHILQSEMILKESKDKILNQDIIYVGGGNTQFMLSKWREYGFDDSIKLAYQNGTLLTGISAGAMCWFERCLSENKNNEYEEFEGLGILKGTFCPHYDDKIRKSAFDQWIVDQENLAAYTLCDSESLHFRDEKLIAKLDT